MELVRKEEGYTLIVVLMVLVVVTVLATSLIGLSINNSTMTRGEHNDQSVFYIAEAGINRALAKIERISIEQASQLEQLETMEETKLKFYSNINASLADFKIEDFGESFGEQPKASIVIDPIDHEGNTKITATGTIGKKKRSLTQEITIAYVQNHLPPEPPTSGQEGEGNENIPNSPVIDIPEGTAVFVKGKITMPNGTVKGNVGTNMKGKGAITLSGGASISGAIYVPEDSEANAVDKPNWMDNVALPTGMIKPGVMELPPFPEYPSLPYPANQTLSRDGNKKNVIENGSLNIDNYISNNYELKVEESMSISTIKISSNYKLKINVGDEDKVIVVDNLDVLNGHIEVIGSGKLTIMVKNQINMGSGSTINNNGSIDQVAIFLQGSTDPNKPKSVQLGGSQKIFGSLYAQDANIHLTGGGGFQGNIFTGGKNVTFDGGVRTESSLVLAPNAAVKAIGGAQVTGAIYADSFEAGGGAVVTYGKPKVNPIPSNPDTNPPKEDKPAITISSHIKIGKFGEN